MSIAIDKQGNTRWTWMDEPFGTSRENNNPTGMATASIPLQFPGQYYDAESGMHYNMQRDYVSGMGRFAQFDPTGLSDGVNGYLYVDGSPTTFYDDT